MYLSHRSAYDDTESIQKPATVGLGCFPFAFEEARILTGSVERELKILRPQHCMCLRFHVTAKQRVRVAVIVAQEIVRQRFKARRFSEKGVDSDAAREDR